jgi:hypothetical protein
VTLTPDDLTDTTVNTDYGTITVARALLALWNRYGWPSDDTLQTIAEEQGVYPPAATSPAEELRTAARRLRSGMLIARADLDPLLAKWLDTTADILDANTHPGWQETVAPDALAVARQINGGQP